MAGKKKMTRYICDLQGDKYFSSLSVDRFKTQSHHKQIKTERDSRYSYFCNSYFVIFVSSHS